MKRQLISKIDVDVIEDHIHNLRVVDDHEGGSALPLEWVKLQGKRLKNYLAYAEFSDEATRIRATSLAAQTFQLLGWMAFEGEQQFHAIQHFQTALRLAYATTDRELIAYTLSCLGYCMIASDTQQGVIVSELAYRMSKLLPARIQAMVGIHHARVCAASRQEDTFYSVVDETQTRFEYDDGSCLGNARWTYWISEHALDAGFGCSMLYFVKNNPPNGSQKLLAKADLMLAPMINNDSATWPRDVTYFLARQTYASFYSNDLDRTATYGHRVVDQIRRIGYHPRSVKLLRTVRAELARNRAISRFRPMAEFHDALRQFVPW